MKKLSQKKFISLLLLIILTTFALPNNHYIRAVGIPDPDPCNPVASVDVADKAIVAINTPIIAGNAIISVPTSDKANAIILTQIQASTCATRKATVAVKDKTVGGTIFGIFIPGLPTSWDGLAKIIIKGVVTQLTNSTVKWINGGFNGGPGYITDPAGFFKTTADTISGDFINGAGLNGLCSSFLPQVRLAIKTEYVDTYQARSQCTLSQVGVNFDNFTKNFNQGGWDAWYQITQKNANNPYGSYLDAKVEMDSRIQNALGLKTLEANWNKGFLSFKGACAVPGANKISSKDGSEIPNSAGPCLVEGQTQTPGSIIEGQLQPILGQGVTDLGLARSFDDMISALVGALTKKIFSSASSLFSPSSSSASSYTSDSPTSPSEPITPPINPTSPVNPPTGTPNDFCFADKQVDTIGIDTTTWSINNGSIDLYNYKWIGDEINQADTYDQTLNYATSTTVVISYKTVGTKSMGVTVIPKTPDANGLKTPLNLTCQSVVLVRDAGNTLAQ
jgi:hypothetical protein